MTSEGFTLVCFWDYSSPWLFLACSSSILISSPLSIAPPFEPAPPADPAKVLPPLHACDPAEPEGQDRAYLQLELYDAPAGVGVVGDVLEVVR